MIEEVRSIIGETLQLGNRKNDLQLDTQLLGSLPELDSMAVVSLITALEDYYGIIVEDDEISAETFETMGSLVKFIEEKINS